MLIRLFLAFILLTASCTTTTVWHQTNSDTYSGFGVINSEDTSSGQDQGASADIRSDVAPTAADATDPNDEWSFQGKDKPFKHVPCKVDADCNGFADTVACPTELPGPKSELSAAVVNQFTGKCLNNNCEMIAFNCSDGDASTWDECSTTETSAIPTFKLGECTHQKPVDTDTQLYKECWCMDVNLLCITTKKGEIVSNIKTPCANGCNITQCK